MYHGSSYNWLSILPLLHVRSGALSGSARAVGTVQTWSVVLQGLWANAYLFYEPWTDVTPLVWNWSHYLCSTAMGMQKYASFIYCMWILPNSVCSHAASHLICNDSHLRWCLNISDLKMDHIPPHLFGIRKYFKIFGQLFWSFYYLYGLFLPLVVTAFLHFAEPAGSASMQWTPCVWCCMTLKTFK